MIRKRIVGMEFSANFQPCHKIEVSDYLHPSFALPPDKELPVLVAYESEWGPTGVLEVLAKKQTCSSCTGF